MKKIKIHERTLQLGPIFLSDAVRKIKILYEGTFHTTPEKLLDILHDFWLSCSSALEGTPISGIQTELEIFDTYSSCIYIKQGWLIIAVIDIRHPNNDLITIALRGSKEGDELSMATDKFLLDFATHLRDLFPEKEQKVLLEIPEMIAIEAAKPEIQETNGESEKVLSKKQEH